MPWSRGNGNDGVAVLRDSIYSADMDLDLDAEFRAIVTALDDAGVDYAVVGALALAVHGAPRATTDIDLLVRPETAERILQLVAALGFGHPALPMTFPDGMRMRRVTKLAEGDSLTLDLILVDPNLESVWATRASFETQAGPVRVISREALIQMKLAAGRTRDIADVERLREQDR